ncbi:helix-turn-helix transcriptional regulator [Cohnella mopanensis]|uniref:helix-turn-helix transcriptional regulator n=1 Tax=Cohnella mopanensis TaxID=2911966 RepID=UPI001EF910BC|nr:AraC family transcriptional regulator [Cohnella mopanensis]
MQLWTEGKTYYTGIRIGMAYASEDYSHEDREVPLGYRILLVREGTGMMQVGDVLYPVVAPGLYCLNDKDKVRFRTSASLKSLSLLFDPSVINDQMTQLLQDHYVGKNGAGTDFQDIWMLEPFIERSSAYYGCMLLDSSAAKYVEEILNEVGSNLTVQPDSYWPCRSRSYLMELLFRIRLLYPRIGYTPSAIPQTGPEAIRPIIEYLHTNYKYKIKLEDLTSRFHVNRTTLNDWFKQSTGHSVISYLCQIRMRIADPMLRNTTLPISEIMEMVGIRDDAHFIRQFRKYSGHSPAEYITKYCTMLS